MLLLISICIFTSCASKIPSATHIDTKLTISAAKEIVSGIAHIAVSFESNSDIHLPNKEVVTISNNQTHLWYLEVLYQDTTPMNSPINFLSNIKLPTKKDYFLLKSGDKYTFSFDVDFTKLAQKPQDFGNTNADYGEYSLKLIYRGPIRIDRKIYEKETESNVVRLAYKKQ